MKTFGLDFNSVVLFERPIIISKHPIYGMFHKNRWIEIRRETEEKLKQFITYLLAIEQIQKNGGYVDNAGDYFFFYIPNPSRQVRVSFDEDMMKICNLLLHGLLKYRIVECPKDLVFSEHDVDSDDYTLITSEDLINKLKDLPDPDILDYLDEYDDEYFKED